MMEKLTVDPEALKNAADVLNKKAAEWNDEAAGIKDDECRKKMQECGEIIREYSALLAAVSSEYDEAGKKMVSCAGDVYEQVRKV